VRAFGDAAMTDISFQRRQQHIAYSGQGAKPICPTRSSGENNGRRHEVDFGDAPSRVDRKRRTWNPAGVFPIRRKRRKPL
jgi:hypothetical protein